MPEVNTHRQIWGIDFPPGKEWDAKITSPVTARDKAGRWTVRRETQQFVVVFHYFSDHHESLLAEYPATEQCELDAKLFALTTEKK
jgi:hypothetical protein